MAIQSKKNTLLKCGMFGKFFDRNAAINLIYRGISIEELAEHSTFEECVFFALYGHLQKQEEFNDFVKEMKGYRVLPQYAEAIISSAPKNAYPMAILQAVI